MATEPVIDYGPLAGLVGTWKGEKGLDVAPEPDGTEKTAYYETIQFEAAGDVTNAESQTLAIVRYHQVVSKKKNDEVFHDEIGYWLWDADSNTVMHSLAIPRSVCVLAGGKASAEGSGTKLEVAAKLGDPDWGIIQSPFMRDNASTKAFQHTIEVDGDRLSYSETTTLEIYGKTFEHTDANELSRA